MVYPKKNEVQALQITKLDSYSTELYERIVRRIFLCRQINGKVPIEC